MSGDIIKRHHMEYRCRIRILHLQNNSSTQTLPSVIAAAQLVANAPMCTWHPNIVANEKCYKCYRLLCLDCRRDKTNKGYQRYYCQTCYEEDCTIL
ncbi:unnamed protein product [Adineta steineri]|uniref:Uncharacterized protein n=1 Tax=Adineta steineri TaxID=433720 RepID=A0A819QK36_9BILA|nr:unnamed protein product [Adineta steineri]CAF1165028.1 unnamed protein product [Adineta steineri]CAF1479683.1 unnamed protein product [Adineta steineri]CAF3818255.1 unnamed protein product [Adineta steineri]CAF3863394.1 unnamed protein product [Adineta steineri]